MDRFEAIERLAGLRDAGVLSESDFQNQKQRLLSGPTALPDRHQLASAPTMQSSAWLTRPGYSSSPLDSESHRHKRFISMAVIGGLLALLAFNNPDESDLRKEFAQRVNAQIVERGKSDSTVAIFGGLLSASGLIDLALTRLPIDRTNFLVFSRFDVDFSALPFVRSADAQRLCLIGVMGQFIPCSAGSFFDSESTSSNEAADAPDSAGALTPTSDATGSAEISEDQVEVDNAEAVPPQMPSFDAYSVELTSRVAPLNLKRGSWSWDYRTRLREAYAEGPNFGANATVALWGCGTGCVFGAVLDRSTGTVHDLPLGGEEQQQLDIQTQAGSNLLLANWNDVSGSTPICVFEALVWTGTQFASVTGFPKKVAGSCPLRDAD